MGDTIRAIETPYNGYKFRSRLEARWAVFFDALGIKYEYEPEGFETSAGRYLPDFRLPELGYWAEVKGFNDHLRKDLDKVEAFVIEQKTAVVILSDLPYDPEAEGLFWFPVMKYLAGGYPERNPENVQSWHGFFRPFGTEDRTWLCDHFYVGVKRQFDSLIGKWAKDGDELKHENERLYKAMQCISGAELDSANSGPGCIREACGLAPVEHAMNIARTARFEHSEAPDPKKLRADFEASIVKQEKRIGCTKEERIKITRSLLTAEKEGHTDADQND